MPATLPPRTQHAAARHRRMAELGHTPRRLEARASLGAKRDLRRPVFGHVLRGRLRSCRPPVDALLLPAGGRAPDCLKIMGAPVLVAASRGPVTAGATRRPRP